MFRFSEAFRTQMVLPLVALFFGTGNQTRSVAAAVIARVFLDPDLRLFDYCPKRLLNSVPVRGALLLTLHAAARTPCWEQQRLSQTNDTGDESTPMYMGLQEMFAFPVLQDVFTTIAANSSYELHCGYGRGLGFGCQG